MKLSSVAFLIAWQVFAGSSRAEEITVATNILGPEGPLFIDGSLYYVGWVSNKLWRWDGKTTTVLNSLEGCSHNGLALTLQHTFLLACTDKRGAILELDMTGKQLRRWDADEKRNKFDGGHQRCDGDGRWGCLCDRVRSARGCADGGRRQDPVPRARRTKLGRSG